MVATREHLILEQGATFIVDLQWLDESGTPVNITGFVFRMQARVKFASTATVLSIGAAEISITDAILGKFHIQVDAAVTAAIPAGDYVYDLEGQGTGGIVTRLLQGKLTVSPEVTR